MALDGVEEISLIIPEVIDDADGQGETAIDIAGSAKTKLYQFTRSDAGQGAVDCRNRSRLVSFQNAYFLKQKSTLS